MRRAVRRAIRDQVELMSERELRRAVSASSADLTTPQGLTTLAQEAGVSLFVRGVVAGSRRAPSLTLTVLSASGEELATTEAGPLRGRAGARAVNEASRTVVGAAIVELDARAAAVREEEARRDQAELDRMREGPANDDGVGEFEEPEDESAGSPSLPLLEIMVGWGGRYRDWDVQLAQPGASRVYSAFFSEFAARLRSHPLRDEGGLLAGFFAQADFALAIGLDSVNDATMEDISTSALRVEGGVGWLFGPFGPVRLGPYLAFGYDSFSFATNPILPTADYTYLRPTIVLHVDLLDSILQLRVDAALRVLLGTGETSPFFGESTTALGFDAGVELGGATDFGLAYGGRFAIQSYGMSFDGEAQEPANTAVDGTDLRLVMTAFLGYRL